MKTLKKVRRSVESLVRSRIIRHGRGWCFTLRDFQDLGNETSIRKALSQLQKKKVIRRLSQGVYDYPRMHKLFGIIPPHLYDVAKVIAEKNGVQIQHAGASCANLVGLSTQVPGRSIFLTEGSSRKVKIGNREIIFQKTTRKNMFAAGTRECILIQGIKNIGKDHMDKIMVARIARFIKNYSTEKEIKKNTQFAPAWIRAIIFEAMKMKL